MATERIFLNKVETTIPVFKIVLVGEKASEKSKLLLKYTESDSTLSTIGIDFRQKDIIYEKKAYMLQIWDTAGQERFGIVTKSYYRGASGFMLLFNVSNQNSFMNIENYVKEIVEYDKTLPFIIVGNKCDDDRVISFNEAEDLAAKFNTNYVEVDYKLNESINDAFYVLLKKII